MFVLRTTFLHIWIVFFSFRKMKLFVARFEEENQLRKLVQKMTTILMHITLQFRKKTAITEAIKNILK